MATTVWRPAQHIRPIAIGIVRRGKELLVVEVRDDAGTTKGWRPLGGTIEFGETAVDALKREFMEELGVAITQPALVTVTENLYQHHNVRGHEIVFLFETTFADAAIYRRETFQFQDGGIENRAQWVDIGRFRDGRAELFPVGLARKI